MTRRHRHPTPTALGAELLHRPPPLPRFLAPGRHGGIGHTTPAHGDVITPLTAPPLGS